MKKKLLSILTAYICSSSVMQAQCISPSPFGSASINGCTGLSVVISGATYKGEYNTLTINTPGVFSFNVTGGSLANFLTLTDDLNNPITFGTPPLQATITTTGVYRLHLTSPTCASEALSHTTSYQCVLPPCTGMPSPGSLSGTFFSICPNSSATFSVSGATIGGGITYQWQESTSATGPFTNVTSGMGGTTETYTTSTSLSTAMYYQMVTTCTASAMSSTTSIVTVSPVISSTCYCNTNLGGNACSEYISNVSITSTSFNNTSTCNNTGGSIYSQFNPSSSTTATLTQGSTYSISITTNTDDIESLWIDYNQNGIFEASEHSQICTSSIANTPTIYTLTIPVSALTGQTGMRIRSRLNGNPNGPTDACSTFGSGEAEDYLIYIDAPITTNIKNDRLSSNSLIIYPNPANESVNIYTDLFTSKTKILIYNSIGALVTETNLTEATTTINTGDFSNGIYIVKLISGDKTISQKLLINK